MKKNIFSFLLFLNITAFSQIDYSDQWEDFYSYNNVKDFKLVDDKIVAIVDNAVFIYDLNSQENQKFSSVHGLSGNTTSSFYYSDTTEKIIIGYETGLIEVIDEKQNIHVSNDIVRLNIPGSKRINNIVEYQNKLYLATDFAIIEYDLSKFEFGDTFYIGNGSTTVKINQTAIFNDTIYAATENGIYSADVNHPFLIDYNNWQQPSGSFIGNFKTMALFNDQLFTSKNNTLYKLLPVTQSLQTIRTFSDSVLNLNASEEFLTITLIDKTHSLNTNLVEMNIASTTTAYDFKLNNAFTKNQTTYLASTKFGILMKSFNDLDYQEIHPDGPLSNEAFSIEVQNNHLWVVYGAHTLRLNFSTKREGFSHFNGEKWINTPFFEINDIDDVRSLIDISIDPNNDNSAYLSSYFDGMIEVIDNEITNIYNKNNSGLEGIFTGSNLTVLGGSTFDQQGNLWIANGWAEEHKIQELKVDKTWQSYDIESGMISYPGAHGLAKIIVDNIGNKWMGSAVFGAVVVNKSGSKAKTLSSSVIEGNLPSNHVKSLAVDKNNRIWIGTIKGLRRFDNVSSLFETDEYEAKKIIIKLEGGTGDDQGQVLLGDQPIYTIAIDGADNKWFGTGNSGVLGTNPSGQKTLFTFNKDNSPLPTNEINEIRVDNTTGNVYFATNKGIVAFKNNVAPFSDTLGETYAYPNPSTKENEFITIDGRHGTHLPRGTNIKILDSAGYLVHETNIIEGIELKGGKAIWDKTNLAGRKVASGIYTILLSIPDASETSITKVAIIN